MGHICKKKSQVMLMAVADDNIGKDDNSSQSIDDPPADQHALPYIPSWKTISPPTSILKVRLGDRSYIF